MPNNYKGIAAYYDFLKKIAFGNSLLDTESYFLKQAEKKSTLLVLGSGSSEFLKHIQPELYQSITCIDKSAKMCHKTVIRASKLGIDHLVTVIEADILTFNNEGKFDIISLPFVLDCQPDNQIHYILAFCHELLNENGSLIITDFKSYENSSYNRMIIKLMYLFFKLFTNISRPDLPNFDQFLDNKYWKIEKRHFHPLKLVYSMKLKKISV